MGSASCRAAPTITWQCWTYATSTRKLTGKEAQEVLDRAGITTNRNQIPDDPRSPFITSGLRVGTAAETTAGMKEAQFVTVRRLDGARLAKSR